LTIKYLEEENNMEKENYTFNDFIVNIDAAHVDFYNEINELLTKNGYMEKVDLKKFGYGLSYYNKSSKKSIINFQTRKKGTYIRIYGNHTDNYLESFTKLPISMIQELEKGHECKRMTDPNACNSRCSMGVNILIDGELYGKCRFAALFFLITSEKYDAIKELLVAEMNERTLK
jgi:hypothetical protein